MSEFKPWKDHVYETVIGDKELTLELQEQYLRFRENLPELINYHHKQFIAAYLAGENNRLWDKLREEYISLQEALDIGEVAGIAAASYRLGIVAQRMEISTDPEYLADAFKARHEKFVREFPLKRKTITQGFLKDLAQAIADKIWREDTDKKIRLADACDHVWPELVEVADANQITDYLPENANSLRPWLRGVAPDYAKKPGRPKK